LLLYEYDGSVEEARPDCVVFTRCKQDVVEIVKLANRYDVSLVGRGAGTGLSGGALARRGGIVVAFSRMNRILEVDVDNQRAVVEPGVVNLDLSRAVEKDGLYFAPDPSSQKACTIGGNVAENSGGVHCLKYGVTTNNVLGCELVLMNGEVLRLGGSYLDSAGYDLLGIVTGSEGLLGVVTEVTVRILKKPETARAALIGFLSSEDGGECVARIIGSGIIPGGMEMMDGPAIRAAEDFVHAGYPLDVEALLIVELDGPRAEVDHLLDRVQKIADECRAVNCRLSNSEDERLLFWAGRKAAFPAVGRISPDYYCMDGTIPRAKLPLVLHRMKELSAKYGLRVANVFHAGDGNLHPLVLYDRSIPGQEDAALELSYRILHLCVDSGGSITGEHGVGKEKQQALGYMFSEPDLATMQLVRCAFDPENIANPDKVFPRPRLCAEKPGPYTPHPLETAGIAEVF
jgi:glycolate oxidase